jgi:glycosyltransferase involved in cell wall biosynthesis
MRIAIVAGPHYAIPPLLYGGTERVIGFLVRGLVELGHEPILLAPGDSKVDCELVPICDAAIGFPPTGGERSDHDALRLETERRMREELLRVLPRVDVVHSHGFDLSDFRDVPNVTTMHGAIGFDNLALFRARRDLYYVSVSRNQQAGFPSLNYLGIAYNGEDPALFPVVTEPDDYVCFVGRLDHEKNPHMAIQLAIHLGIPIKLAGKIDFQGERYFATEIEPYLDHPLVEFLGEADNADTTKLLARARCNLHPTGFREPFGLTVLEAAYCGTPTLAIARGSMPELIEVGRTGVLVEDFVEGVHQVEECFDLDRAYIAERARRLFNYQTMTKQYVRAYERVLGIFDARREPEHFGSRPRLARSTERRSQEARRLPASAE